MRVSLSIFMLFALFLLGGTVFAENMELQEKTAIDARKEVGNRICPVGGEEIGSMGEPVKYEYNGKIYNICCPGCVKKFEEDPEKFSKMAEDSIEDHQGEGHDESSQEDHDDKEHGDGDHDHSEHK